MRTRAWRRAQRDRWINRRKHIVQAIWLESRPEGWWSKLSKHNLTCRPRCGLCKPWKRWPSKQNYALSKSDRLWLSIQSAARHSNSGI
jgi:hypothetical protein